MCVIVIDLCYLDMVLIVRPGILSVSGHAEQSASICHFMWYTFLAAAVRKIQSSLGSGVHLT